MKLERDSTSRIREQQPDFTVDENLRAPPAKNSSSDLTIKTHNGLKGQDMIHRDVMYCRLSLDESWI